MNSALIDSAVPTSSVEEHVMATTPISKITTPSGSKVRRTKNTMVLTGGNKRSFSHRGRHNAMPIDANVADMGSIGSSDGTLNATMESIQGSIILDASSVPKGSKRARSRGPRNPQVLRAQAPGKVKRSPRLVSRQKVFKIFEDEDARLPSMPQQGYSGHFNSSSGDSLLEMTPGTQSIMGMPIVHQGGVSSPSPVSSEIVVDDQHHFSLLGEAGFGWEELRFTSDEENNISAITSDFPSDQTEILTDQNVLNVRGSPGIFDYSSDVQATGDDEIVLAGGFVLAEDRDLSTHLENSIENRLGISEVEYEASRVLSRLHAARSGHAPSQPKVIKRGALKYSPKPLNELHNAGGPHGYFGRASEDNHEVHHFAPEDTPYLQVWRGKRRIMTESREASPPKIRRRGAQRVAKSPARVPAVKRSTLGDLSKTSTNPHFPFVPEAKGYEFTGISEKSVDEVECKPRPVARPRTSKISVDEVGCKPRLIAKPRTSKTSSKKLSAKSMIAFTNEMLMIDIL